MTRQYATQMGFHILMITHTHKKDETNKNFLKNQKLECM